MTLINSSTLLNQLKEKGLFKEEELVKILKGLIQEKSENPTGNEESAALYVQRVLRDNDIESELSWAAPNRPNVYARLKGQNPGSTMMYNGHLDVVPAGDKWSKAPFEGIVEEGKLFGRGAADMKSGVASMIYAAIVLKRMGAPFHGELFLFFNVDEERTNLGMKKFLEDNLSADYAIISEPTNLNICIGHRGCARFRLRTKGTLGHTSFVRDPDNAIYKMTKLIHAIEELGLSVRKRVDPFLGNASLTVSQIQGGIAPNIVPDDCQIEIDRRALPGETYDTVYNELKDYLDQVSRNHAFEYELECYLFLPASFIPREHSFVKQLSHVSSKVRKKETNITPFEATCEAPFFSVDKGIPTIVFGPGGLKEAHITDEFVELSELTDASLVFIDFMLKMKDTGFKE